MQWIFRPAEFFFPYMFLIHSTACENFAQLKSPECVEYNSTRRLSLIGGKVFKIQVGISPMCMSYVLHRRTWGILSLMIGFNLHQSRASDFIALIFKWIVFSFVGGDEYLSSCGQRKSKADGSIKVVRVHIKCNNLIKNKKTIKSHKRECLSSPLFKTVIRLPK